MEKEKAKSKVRIRDFPEKLIELLHPSSVTWLSFAEATKRTAVVVAMVAASSVFMIAADAAFGEFLKLIV